MTDGHGERVDCGNVKGFAMRWLARAFVVLLACAPAVGAAVPSAGSLREPYFGAQATPAQALPGRDITVDLSNLDKDDRYYMTACKVWFASEPKQAASCPMERESPFKASIKITVPAPRGGDLDRLHWEVSYSAGDSVEGPSRPLQETDVVPFTILRVDVTTEPVVATPGEPLKVVFSTPTPNLQIHGCYATFAELTSECDSIPAANKEIEIAVPDHVPPGKPLDLTWVFNIVYTGSDPPLEDKDFGEIEVRIAPPPPQFGVSSSTAQPGMPLVVSFRSNTTGVTVDECAIEYQGRVPCSSADTAVITVPRDARVGSMLRIPWSLSYRSSRPDEQDDDDAGTLEIPVVVELERFTVTAQPSRGSPLDEITLTITPAFRGITIGGCMAFFPNDTGAKCQATDERWFVRTRVPAGTLPGSTLLRWGVASVDDAGEPLSDNGDLPFEVLPPRTTKSPTTTPSRNGPTTLPPTELPPTEESTTPAPTSTERPPAAFVARTDPEAAKPGGPVNLSVSALTPGTDITGCRAAFSGERVVPCDGAGDRWTAELTVPDDAEPGDLPLLWDVAARTGSDRGTIAYRVLGGDQSEAQFGVQVEPASVRPGEHVRVTHQTFDNSPAITGCTAGIAPGGVLADCTRTAAGWVTDVIVPKEAPPGTAILVWQVTYASAEAADTATADGRTSVGVLDAAQPETRSWWNRSLGVIWRAAAVILLGAAFIGGRILIRRVFSRIPPNPPRIPAEDPRMPDGVDVVAVLPPSPPLATVGEPDAAPRRLIRLVVRQPPPGIRVREEAL
ncbi:hypothetical protein AB0F81_09790 [Actinoplanes sp. NPDC024001]|uniref:hypothetical protein n=1 Tax=Actinoplanes sp. NPDC024001 TaxID=3154598 RepID=UPI0033F470D4